MVGGLSRIWTHVSVGLVVAIVNEFLAPFHTKQVPHDLTGLLLQITEAFSIAVIFGPWNRLGSKSNEHCSVVNEQKAHSYVSRGKHGGIRGFAKN